MIEIVYGNVLEDRFNQLLKLDRKNITLRLISQHVYDFEINGTSLKTRLERLIKNGARIILIIDKKIYSNKAEVQIAADELDSVGVRVYHKRNIHAKIVSLETKTEKGFLLSSANLSHTALHVNKEAGIFVLNDTSDQLADDINQFFRQILGSD